MKSTLLRPDLTSSFKRQRLMQLMNAKLSCASDGQCRLEVHWADWFSQHLDVLHGGILASLADTAATYAVMSLQQPGELAATVEFKISFVAPARGKKVIAVAQASRMGRRLSIARVEVSCDEGPACAEFLGTFVCLSGAAQGKETVE